MLPRPAAAANRRIGNLAAVRGRTGAAREAMRRDAADCAVKL
jgi:hypothetical protein